MFQRPRRQSLSTLQQMQFKIEVRTEIDLANAILAASTRYQSAEEFSQGFLVEITEPLRLTTKVLIPLEAAGLTITSPGRVPITASRTLATIFEVNAPNCTFDNLSINNTDQQSIGVVFELKNTARYTQIINVTATGDQLVGGDPDPPLNTNIAKCIFNTAAGSPQPKVLIGSLAKVEGNVIPGRLDCAGRETAITGNTVIGITITGGGISGVCSIANNILNGSTIDTTAAAFGSVISGNVP